MAFPSPCTGLCSFERRTGYCIGCARTSDEIVGWRAATDETREAIMGQLAARKARLGLVRRLPWGLDEIKGFIIETFAGTGSWVTGIHGAAAAFRRSPEEKVEIHAFEDTIAASTTRAAISFRLSTRIRAYAVKLWRKDEASDPSRVSSLSDLIVIAVSRSCGLADEDKGLICRGTDSDAILGRGGNETFYDFGLGNRAGSFGIRTADRALEESMKLYLGEEWPVFFPAVGDEIMRAAPTRIVRNPIGRVEVSTSLWSGYSTSDPYAHFIPPYLRMSESAEPAMEIVDSYLPCAVHYPA